jgi:integrase
VTYLEKVRNIFIIELLVVTGMRPVELERAKLSHLTESKGKHALFIPAVKGTRSRTIPFESNLRMAFEAYFNERIKCGARGDVLFYSMSKKSVGFKRAGLRKLVTKINKDVSFNLTMYGVRRYVATSLYENGIDLDDIREHLGHTNVKTTLKYIQSSSKKISKNITFLDQLSDIL